MFQSNASVITYANKFLAHWGQVDVFIGAGPAFFLPVKPGIIPPNFNRSGLTALRDLLEDQFDAVQAKLNLLQTNSGAIAIQKETLLKQLRLFLGVVDAYYSNTPFIKSRPDAPSLSAGPDAFITPLLDAKSLWAQLNAAAPSGVALPITVDTGTVAVPVIITQALFAAAIQELRDLYEQRTQCEFDLGMARSFRDETIKAIYAVLVSYRSSVTTRISTSPVLLNMLPSLTPEAGHTPDAVDIETSFTAPDTATLSHTESAEPTFESYDYLGAPGEDALLEDAVLLATRTNRTPEPFTTTLGLGSPGGAVTLWVKVNLTTGNERTSEKSVVRRPL